MAQRLAPRPPPQTEVPHPTWKPEPAPNPLPTTASSKSTHPNLPQKGYLRP